MSLKFLIVPVLCWLEWVFSDFPDFPNVTCSIYFIMKWKRRIVLLFNFLNSSSVSGYWKHSCWSIGIYPLSPHRISSLWIQGNPLSSSLAAPLWVGVEYTTVTEGLRVNIKCALLAHIQTLLQPCQQQSFGTCPVWWETCFYWPLLSHLSPVGPKLGIGNMAGLVQKYKLRP